MQAKIPDRVLLNAQARAEPADNAITRDYYASLPQIRLTGAPSANPATPGAAVEIILDGNDVARLVECALRHPQPNMRYGVLAAIWNHAGVVSPDFRVRPQRAGKFFGNPQDRRGGIRQSRPRPAGRFPGFDVSGFDLSGAGESGRQAAIAAHAIAGAPEGPGQPVTRRRSNRLDSLAAAREIGGIETLKPGSGEAPWRERLPAIAASSRSSPRARRSGSMSATAKPASIAPDRSSTTAAAGRKARCASRARIKSTPAWPTAALRSAFISARIAAPAYSGKATRTRRPAASRSAVSPTPISRPPDSSGWEEAMHSWLGLPPAIARFPQSRS